MKETSAIRQLPRAVPVGTVWIPVRNSLDVISEAQGETMTVSVDLDVDHAKLLDVQSAVENSVLEHANRVAKEKGEPQVKAKVKWSRKEMASTFLRAQCDDLRQRLAEQIKACGPLPDPDDAEAVSEYAEKVYVWRNKKLNRG